MGTPIDPGAAAEQGNDNAPGPNPAWNDVLSVIPEQFHPMVTPHFQKWDQSAQERIEQANAKVKEFEPYQDFVEHGIDPEELGNGLRLMYEINQNPQAVYEALGNAYGLTTSEVKEAIADELEGEGEESSNPQAYQDPRVDQLQQGIELVSSIILEEQQTKAQNAADAELENEMSSLKEKHGEFNERYVLAMMLHGMDADEAVQSYKDEIGAISGQNAPAPFAPQVMGSSSGGSGLPSQAIDPTKLDRSATKSLVAQMLEQAAQQK